MPFLDEGGGGGGLPASLFDRRRREGPYPPYAPPMQPAAQAVGMPALIQDPRAVGLQGITGSPTAQMGYQRQKGSREQNIAYAMARLALLQQIGLGQEYNPGSGGEEGADPLAAYTAASRALTQAAQEAGFADPRQYLVWRLKQVRGAQKRGYAGGR